MSEPKTPQGGYEVVETADVLDRPSPYEYGGRNEQECPYEYEEDKE